MEVKAYVRWVVILVPCALAFNRFGLRPWILAFDSPPEAAVIFVGSFPNFLEGMIGTLVLSLGASTWLRSGRQYDWMPESRAHLAAAWVALIYVVAQELNFHSLGGANVYDPYDVVASVLGVAITCLVIRRVGLFES